MWAFGNSVISDHDRQSLQKDLHKISAWFERWEMPFHVNKCHILQVGKKENWICSTKFESVQSVKHLGVTIALYLKFSWECKNGADKGQIMLDFVSRNFFLKNKEIILPLYQLNETPLGACSAIMVSSPHKGQNKIWSYLAYNYRLTIDNPAIDITVPSVFRHEFHNIYIYTHTHIYIYIYIYIYI